MVKMSDICCSIVIRLTGSKLRCLSDKCDANGSRGVNFIFGHFFVTTLLYTNIRKQFA